MFINSFIVLLLLFIWCWDYPPDHPAKKFITKFSFPFVYMGFWHGWAMFAPGPIHVNRRLRAVLTFADGAKEDWSPLGPDSRSKLINLLYARSFKCEHSLLGPRVLHLYGPLCDFLTRQVQVDGRTPFEGDSLDDVWTLLWSVSEDDVHDFNIAKNVLFSSHKTAFYFFGLMVVRDNLSNTEGPFL